MRSPSEHLALLKRRAEYLRERVANSPRANDYDRAEMAMLDWVLVQLESAPQYLALLHQVELVLVCTAPMTPQQQAVWPELERLAKATRERLSRPAGQETHS